MSKDNDDKGVGTQLSDEFKRAIREDRGKKNILGTILAFLAVVLVFGTIGIAGYELFFKTDASTTKTADEKIESSPTANDVAVTTNDTTAATTDTTTTDSADASTSTSTADYTEYTVVAGDSYSSIANENDLSSTELMEYNDTTDENLQIGQVIKIPNN